MKKSLFSSVFVALVLAGWSAVACSSSSDSSGSNGSSAGSSCTGPQHGTTTNKACESCIQDSCGDQFSAYCAGNCSKNGSSSACQKATQNISDCVVSKCFSECDDSSSSHGGSSSGGSSPGLGGAPDQTSDGGASFGTPTTQNCKALAECCQTFTIKDVKDPCLQAAGYDNDAPCLNLLNTYRNAGQCTSGGNGGTTPVACYIETEKTCTKTPVPTGSKDMYESACTDGGGIASEDCPTKDLLGCCTFGGTTESCVYADSDQLDKAMCEQSGGTWSEKP